MPGKNHQTIVNETILQFLRKQTCAGICCVDEQNKPYCFSCFYAFDPASVMLYFKSSDKSHHVRLIKKNPVIAGTILPDKLNRLVVAGVQFGGRIVNEQHPLSEEASGLYLAKYPISLAIPGKVWAVRIDFIKMTDSSKLFGKKLLWSREKDAGSQVNSQ